MKPNLRFVRYAGDWCVFIVRGSQRFALRLRDDIQSFLRQSAGLELLVEKTRITHVRDGFDFLGFRLCRETGQRGVEVPKIKVGEKAKKNIRLRLDEALRYRPQQESMTLRVQRASMLVRGWREYFRIAHDLSGMANDFDCHAFWSATKAGCRKFDISTAKCLKRFYRHGRFIVGDLELARFSGTPLKLDYRGPEEYRPGKGVYLEDHECEANHYFKESRRVWCDGVSLVPPHRFCRSRFSNNMLNALAFNALHILWIMHEQKREPV